MSELSFCDPTTGEDKTEQAKKLMREKAPELLQLMAQVRVREDKDEEAKNV